MGSIVALFVGAILMGVGIVVYVSIGDNPSIRVNNVPTSLQSMSDGAQFMIRYGIACFIGGLGSVFFLGGLIGFSRGRNKAKRLARIAQTGIAAEATVTFVDKNFLVLVNKTPIYSIVEYRYRDTSGNEHVRRVDNVSSELVIRNKVEVGGKVRIKYAQEDPGQSVLLF